MGELNPQAIELNQIIKQNNPYILDMLSKRGQGIFFPKKGILAQSAEAKGKDINATIGIALEDDGSPLRLDCIARMIDLDPAHAFPYAPSYGIPSLREAWLHTITEKNPSLSGITISRPVVTSALTHGLSLCGYLFLDEGDRFYTPDLFWGNYRLVFINAYSAEFITYDTFKNEHFNIDGLREQLSVGPVGKRIVSLNFPNNPSGYTLTTNEANRIKEVLVEAADAGNSIVAIIDDAYFGLVYEEGIIKESIFSLLANAHERLLAVKIDGATKEDYVWGFRVGFITFGIEGGNGSLYEALEAKTAGAIRGNVSNSPHISQSLLNKAYTFPGYHAQKKEKYLTLKRRYDKIKEILSNHSEYEQVFSPVPFNSGYFMCIKPRKADPEKVRQILLKDFSTGVIAGNGVIRIAFSSTPYPLLEKLFDNVYKAIVKAENV